MGSYKYYLDSKLEELIDKFKITDFSLITIFLSKENMKELMDEYFTGHRFVVEGKEVDSQNKAVFGILPKAIAFRSEDIVISLKYVNKNNEIQDSYLQYKDEKYMI